MSAFDVVCFDSVSESVAKKSRRLIESELVIHGQDDGDFRVKGDHGFYAVKIHSYDGVSGETIGSCSCPAYGGCSHLYAVLLFARKNGETLPKPLIDADPFSSIV